MRHEKLAALTPIELRNIARRHSRTFTLQRAACEVLCQAVSRGLRNWRNCEAIFSEVIVYRALHPWVYEGVIRSIHLEKAESDIIVERLDGSRMFLEVFCVMPSFQLRDEDREPNVYSVKTHTQTEMASIRSKASSQNLQTEPTLRSRVRTLQSLNSTTQPLREILPCCPHYRVDTN